MNDRNIKLIYLLWIRDYVWLTICCFQRSTVFEGASNWNREDNCNNLLFLFGLYQFLIYRVGKPCRSLPVSIKELMQKKFWPPRAFNKIEFKRMKDLLSFTTCGYFDMAVVDDESQVPNWKPLVRLYLDIAKFWGRMTSRDHKGLLTRWTHVNHLKLCREKSPFTGTQRGPRSL